MTSFQVVIHFLLKTTSLLSYLHMVSYFPFPICIDRSMHGHVFNIQSELQRSALRGCVFVFKRIDSCTSHR